MNAGLAKPIPSVLVYSGGSPDMPWKCLLQRVTGIFALTARHSVTLDQLCCCAQSKR
jgi:hypothetical protein